MRPTTLPLVIAVAALAAAAAPAAQQRGFGLEVLLDGAPRPEHPLRGTTYIEALRGREYVLRVSNPLPVRVAVALAVDGLNTIDARHTDARGAAKWVLGPHETIVIPGWQVSGMEARAFYFTGERDSYGARLGSTENLGVIEAVFFREKARVVPVIQPRPAAGAVRERAALDAASSAAKESAAAPSLADDYAATGIGDRQAHEVISVRLDLEREPAATVRLRYEFRRELERLGVLPRWPRAPLDRRESGRGFEPPFCPDLPPGR